MALDHHRTLGHEDEDGGLTMVLDGEDATAALAARLAALARPGDVIALKGPLGVGKTTFARFFLHALGVEEDIPSPTFALVQTYDPPAAAAPRIWHFDFYRIDSPAEAYELGFEDAFDDDISLIEWPEKLGSLLPEARLELAFAFADDVQTRRLVIRPCGATWTARTAHMAAPGETP